MKTFELQGARGVVVTGGSSGIGHAIVLAHVGAGDEVVVLDRDLPAKPFPDGVTVVQGDVTRYADHVAAVDEILRRAGRLDHFVGNAGVHDGGIDVMSTPGEQLERIMRNVLDINVVGYLLGAKASAQALSDVGGCMTFTLSDATYVVSGNGAGVAYTTSKHAGLGLVRHLASELAPKVRVNAVAPGGVITGLRARHADGTDSSVFENAVGVESTIAELNPLGVVLTAAQVADLYLFLASPLARGMTGEVLRPDGGLSVRTTPQHRGSGSTNDRSTS